MTPDLTRNHAVVLASVMRSRLTRGMRPGTGDGVTSVAVSCPAKGGKGGFPRCRRLPDRQVMDDDDGC